MGCIREVRHSQGAGKEGRAGKRSATATLSSHVKQIRHACMHACMYAAMQGELDVIIDLVTNLEQGKYVDYKILNSKPRSTNALQVRWEALWVGWREGARQERDL
jgi:hypothetical protein